MDEAQENLETAPLDDGEPSKPKRSISRKCWDWLDGYQEFTEDFEPPRVFNKWCGLVALAAATGRKVWLAEANTHIYPNLFVVLVASSGVGKTTAMREVKPFIDELGVAMSAGKPSPAKFLTSMSEAVTPVEGLGLLTNYLIWAEELPSFLGTDAYKNGLIADLTTLYDCPDLWSKETHIRSVEEIAGAYLCMLGGTTAEGLFDVMPKGSVTQGFTARLLFIHALYNEKRVVEKPWGKKQERLLEPLKLDLKHIATLCGPARFSDIARVMWADYYVNRPQADEEFADTRLQGYAARKPFYAKKLALLLSVSEGDSLVIEAHHLEKAFKLIEEVDCTLNRVYSDIAPSVAIQSYGKIIAKLQRNGGSMTRSKLMQSFAYAMDAQDFTKAVDALRDMGLIDVEVKMPSQQGARLSGGRATTIYTLTEGGRKWQKT
jgi:hypothetical protein